MITFLVVVYTAAKNKEKVALNYQIPALKAAKLRLETIEGLLLQNYPETASNFIADSKNWFIENKPFLPKKVMGLWDKIQKENTSWPYNKKIHKLIENAKNEIAKQFKK